MTGRFLVVGACLVATVGFVIGLVFAGSLTPAPAHSAPEPVALEALAGETAPLRPAAAVAWPPSASFADVAEQLNPAVVTIDATTRGGATLRRPLQPDRELFERPGEREPPRRGAGTGFLIDPEGYILTNHHVIDGADRILVRLTDGRSLRAEEIGSDPDTDIALIKVEASGPLPWAPLGDSDTLRVGDWVVAIGNPLAYEHTVTAGVVSFIGRKLFDSSLDRYIQTDAAINFGNSGGPLINIGGEVVGINAAISSRASNIGFAVPINQAREILPQLREHGRVARGFIGVVLRDVDPDLQRSLGLSTASGALVQDVTSGSPGARAGIRTYDLVTAVDGQPIAGNDELIKLIAARQPGTAASLRVLRDGRALDILVKLAERPLRDRREPAPARIEGRAPADGPALGLTVREIDAEFSRRYQLPGGLEGLVVARVEPMSPAFDAEIERHHVLLEINRQPVRSVEAYRRLVAGAGPGDVLAFYVYKPDLEQRALHTVTVH
jgi:serine protease Do